MGESATIGLRLAAGCLFGLLLALPVSDARAQFDPALPDGTGPPAQAAPVEELLDRLSAAEDESEARRLERIILRAWQNTDSPTINILFRRAGAALGEEDYTLAFELVEAIVILAPDFAEGWNMRATLYYRLGDHERALENLAQVLALEPRHFAALGGLGIILRDLGEKPAALSVMRRAREIHPYYGALERMIERLSLEVEGRGI